MPKTTSTKIKDLFASDIHRRIEEVIKVDQGDEQIIKDELAEYVITDSIARYFTEILESYCETPRKPHEGGAIWISGFFGSGKSSFAKILGLILKNKTIGKAHASDLFCEKITDQKVQVLLKTINEQIPTEAAIFDVSTDRGIRTGQTLTEIMYKVFLHALGYAQDFDLAELEISLEGQGKLDLFKKKYRSLFEKAEWDQEKDLPAISIGRASAVLHEMETKAYPTVDSWYQAIKGRSDISPGKFAERCMELMKRRCEGKTLVFVIDEVGQFVARDVQRMLDLQGLVQSFGRVGRGKLWIVVTSQEKLTELVGGLDDRRVELARLMDRFPIQVHLEPSDIREVTSKRVLSKNAAAQKMLTDLYGANRGRLTENTRMTADIRLPELTQDTFFALYPLLPYQVDLIIQIVSGLRTQGGAGRHVGGANRTIIKLAQQLLIHPGVNLAEQEVGRLASVDNIYDMVSGNIPSEIRSKIDSIKQEVDHELAQPVAKAICLLQYVKSIHRTAENIAASLYPSVTSDSLLPQVKEALDQLIKSQKIRMSEDGYRIPSPAEDDWDRQRQSLAPKHGEMLRIYQEILSVLWQPKPSCNFYNTKIFKAGLLFNGRVLHEGDVNVHLSLAAPGGEYENLMTENRERSQQERHDLFWIASLNDAIEREAQEYFRSREMLTRKERNIQTKDESALIAEEKVRQRRHDDELKRLIQVSVLQGIVYFQGNDRSPSGTQGEIESVVSKIMQDILPDIYERFQEASARIQKADLEMLMTAENLRGLSPVFPALNLIADHEGQPIFVTDRGPLHEVLTKIENRTSYGEPATGKYLADEFAKAPFGWDFEAVRLFVISLLRAGKIEATSRGQLLDSALSVEAKNTFSNNNLFKQTSFRLKAGLEFGNLVEATEHFKNVFGQEVSEIEQSSIVRSIREKLASKEETMHEIYTTLVTNGLPGTGILQETLAQIRSIRMGNEVNAIKAFNAAYNEIKVAICRISELEKILDENCLRKIKEAQNVLSAYWPQLVHENISDDIRKDAQELADKLGRETFYEVIAEIFKHAKNIHKEYEGRLNKALDNRVSVYTKAIDALRSIPGWERLGKEKQEVIAAPLSRFLSREAGQKDSISLISADIDACPGRLEKAIKDFMQILDGERMVTLKVGDYFRGGIENQEQLEEAIKALKEECQRLLGAGKKILLQ